MSSMHSDTQRPNEDIVVEFQLSGEEIKLMATTDIQPR